MADVHFALHGKISEVSSQVLKWKADTYHKGIIGIKEVKKAEEGFSKAQKPWAKKFDDSRCLINRLYLYYPVYVNSV